MNGSKTKVEMKYEGDKRDKDNLECVWYVEGKENFRMKYRDMYVISAIYSANYQVTEVIIHWAKMLNNPD